MTRIAAFLILFATAGSAWAAEIVEFSLIIKNHQFEPAKLVVPAGKKVKLLIDNQDSTPEEFESHVLNREKVILGNSKGVVLIGPLKPGQYNYFGEFHESTAKGVIVAQ